MALSRKEKSLASETEIITLDKLPDIILIIICDHLSPYLILKVFANVCQEFNQLTKRNTIIQRQAQNFFKLNNYDAYITNWKLLIYSLAGIPDKNRAAFVVACITEDLKAFKAILNQPDYLLQQFLAPYPHNHNDYFYHYLRKTNRRVCLDFFVKNLFDFKKPINFILAARFGCMEVVKEMVTQTPTLLDTVDNENNTALMWAAHHDDVDIVHFLLMNQANLQIKATKIDPTCYQLASHDVLDRAIFTQATQVIPILLKKFEKQEGFTEKVRTSLKVIISNQLSKSLEALLLYDTSLINIRGASCWLTSAINYGDRQLIEVIFKYASFLLHEKNLSEIFDYVACFARDKSLLQLLQNHLSISQKELMYQMFDEQYCLAKQKIKLKLESLEQCPNSMRSNSFAMNLLLQLQTEIIKMHELTPISNMVRLYEFILNSYNQRSLGSINQIYSFLLPLMTESLVNIFGKRDYLVAKSYVWELLLFTTESKQLFIEIETQVNYAEKFKKISVNA